MATKLLAVIAVLIAGCATKPAPAPSKITPPVLKKSVAAIPFSVIPMRTNLILHWEDCAEQPEGTWYRIYDTDDFSYWSIYQETLFKFIVIPIAPGCRFFRVSAVNTNGETFAGRECP